MKKTYMTPATKEMKIELNHIVCVSDGTLDSSQSINDVNSIGSRRGNFFDDDDDY